MEIVKPGKECWGFTIIPIIGISKNYDEISIIAAWLFWGIEFRII